MEGIGKGIGTLFVSMAVALAITLPLGVWKAVEIFIYVWNHFHWGDK